jgi:hypothetical protein
MAKSATKSRQTKRSQQLAVTSTSALQERIQQQKKDLIAALWANKGIIQKAVAQVGLNRSTYYEYFNNDPEFKKQAQEAQEVALDHVEGKLHELIDGVDVMKMGEDGPQVYSQPPNVTATIFYLKTKGKKRGYVEKEHPDININITNVESPEHRCDRWINDMLKIRTDDGRSPTLEQAYQSLLWADIDIPKEVREQFIEEHRRKWLGEGKS